MGTTELMLVCSLLGGDCSKPATSPATQAAVIQVPVQYYQPAVTYQPLFVSQPMYQLVSAPATSNAATADCSGSNDAATGDTEAALGDELSRLLVNVVLERLKGSLLSSPTTPMGSSDCYEASKKAVREVLREEGWKPSGAGQSADKNQPATVGDLTESVNRLQVTMEKLVAQLEKRNSDGSQPAAQPPSDQP